MDLTSGNVAQTSAELVRVAELLRQGPQTAQYLQMFNAFERFKETSPLCAQCGLYLAQKRPNHNPAIRHLGLLLIEHCVKYRWTQITQPEKIFIKDNTMKLLQEGTEPLMQEENCVKNSLAKIIVEMIIREWPQQWPSLLDELSQSCSCGETQTELVLMVFVRLAEDVAVYQNVESNQRRKDIYQALTTNMGQIFTFFLRLIEQNYQEFQNKSVGGITSQAAENCRIVQFVLETLAGFVDWVSIHHIMTEEGRLLHILCVLLRHPKFRLPAAECLSQIVNRKGKAEERKQLMVLFSEEALQRINDATRDELSTGANDLKDYNLFLVKLVQVLAGMSLQLCTYWGKDDPSPNCPAQINLFLDTLLSFTMRPSMSLVHSANNIWIQLFKHDLVKSDPLFLSYIPKYVELTAPKLMKASYANGRQSNGFSTLCSEEFDSELEFKNHFARHRAGLLEGFRHATMVAPLVTFALVQRWLTLKIRNGMANLGAKCERHSDEYQEWKALGLVADSVMSRILMASERPSVQSGLELLELCLNYSPLDPLLLSSLLSCISALFVFLSMSTGSMAMPGVAILPRVLDKVFTALLFLAPGETPDSVLSQETKELRHHAASLMVKIGLKYPLLLLPVFDQMHETVRCLVCERKQVTGMRSVKLYEALILISNQFCDYERQTRFIAQVICEGSSKFLSIGEEAFKGPIELLRFMGLDRVPMKKGMEDPLAKNRQDLMYCVMLISSVVKYSLIPEDPDRASRGGFVAALSESGNPVYRNPAAPYVISTLGTMFLLIKCMNEFFTPPAMALLHEGFRNAHDITEHDKKMLLGWAVTSENSNSESYETDGSLEKMKSFLTNLNELCYHMLGSMCHTMGRDFYQLPGLAHALLNSVFLNLEVIPDHRLRPIIRVFLKPFVFYCPPAFYETVLLPVLAHVTTHMHRRLGAKWASLGVQESGSIEETDGDTQEVMEDILNRNLTRDLMEVLKVAMVGGAASDAAPPDSMEADNEGMVVDLPPRNSSSLIVEVISELGTAVLKHPLTCDSVVLCVLEALWWNDSNASLKAAILTAPIVRALVAENLLNPSMASQIMVAVLRGLQLHGQHEANQASLNNLGTQVYECLRPQFPNIIEVMQQIPGVNPADLQRFDEKMQRSQEKMKSSGTKGNKVEKAKKDLFKKITNQLVGKSLGQLFQKEVKIDNLPSLQVQKAPIARVDELAKNASDVGLANLFAGST